MGQARPATSAAKALDEEGVGRDKSRGKGCMDGNITASAWAWNYNAMYWWARDWDLGSADFGALGKAKRHEIGAFLF